MVSINSEADLVSRHSSRAPFQLRPVPSSHTGSAPEVTADGAIPESLRPARKPRGTRILATAPGVILIVARISPYAWFNQELWDYNLYISDDLIPTYAADGYTVGTVDLYSLFLVDAEDPTSITPSGHSNKINHPSPALYTQMAQVWFDGLEPFLKNQAATRAPF